MASYDMSFGSSEEAAVEEPKKKRNEPLQKYYEALEALLEAQARLEDPRFVGDISPPIVLIASDGGRFEISYYKSIAKLPNDPEHMGVGESADEAFSMLLESVKDHVEAVRKKAMSGIDQLLRKGGAAARRGKKKAG